MFDPPEDDVRWLAFAHARQTWVRAHQAVTEFRQAHGLLPAAWDEASPAPRLTAENAATLRRLQRAEIDAHQTASQRFREWTRDPWR